MHSKLKKMLLAAFPLMSLLLVSPAAFAYHDRALDRELEDDWARYRDEQYGYDRPYDDDSYDRYGYDEGHPYDDDSYRGYSYDRYGYGRRPNYGNQYGYGSGSYDDEGYYPGSSYPEPYSLGPSSVLPSLLGLPLDIFLPR